MSHQFVYTSVPSGLKPGSQGYCMVAATQGLPQNLASQLEKLSGYKHLFKPNDRKNPVGYGHVVIRVSGTVYHVVSRVADAGLDYTNRSNLIAHHMALQATEQPEGGPAWLLGPQQGAFFTEWSGDPRQLPDFRAASGGDRAGVCHAWQAASGHTGWGGVVAETALSTVPGKVAIIYPAGLDMLPLLRESMALLPPNIRWQVTFNTYFTQLLPGQECHWRCIPAGTPQAKNLRGMTVIDLSAGQPPPAGRGKEAGERGTMLETATRATVPKPHTGGSVAPTPVANQTVTSQVKLGELPSGRDDDGLPVSAVGGAAPPQRNTPPQRAGAGIGMTAGGEIAGPTLHKGGSKGEKAKNKSSSHLLMIFYVLLFCIFPIAAVGGFLVWPTFKEVVGLSDGKQQVDANKDESVAENNKTEENNGSSDGNQGDRGANGRSTKAGVQEEPQKEMKVKDVDDDRDQDDDQTDEPKKVRLTLLEKSDGVLDLNKNAAAGETPHWTVTLDEDTNAALIYKLDPPDFGNIEVKPEIESENNIVVEVKPDGSDQLTIKPNKDFFTDSEGLTYRIEHNQTLIGQLTIIVNGKDDPLEFTDLPEEVRVNVKEKWSFSLKAKDPDAPENEAFTYELPNVPNGMEFEPSTGKISWTPNWSDLGSQQVTVAVRRQENVKDDPADTTVAAPGPHSKEEIITIKVDAPQNLGLPERSIDDIPEDPKTVATIVDLPDILKDLPLTLRLIPESGYELGAGQKVTHKATLDFDYPSGTKTVWNIRSLDPKANLKVVAYLCKTDHQEQHQLKIKIGKLEPASKKKDLAETLGLLRLQVTLEDKPDAVRGEIQLEYNNEAQEIGSITQLLEGKSTDVKKWPPVKSIDSWGVEATPAEGESSKVSEVIKGKDAQKIGKIILHEPKGEGDAWQADLYIQFDDFWNLKTTLTWTHDEGKPEDLYDDSIKLEMGRIDVVEVHGRGQEFGLKKEETFDDYDDFIDTVRDRIIKGKRGNDKKIARLKKELEKFRRDINSRTFKIQQLNQPPKKKNKNQQMNRLQNEQAEIRGSVGDAKGTLHKYENENKRFSELLGHPSISKSHSELIRALRKLEFTYSFDVATPPAGAVGVGASEGVSPPTE